MSEFDDVSKNYEEALNLGISLSGENSIILHIVE